MKNFAFRLGPSENNTTTNNKAAKNKIRLPINGFHLISKYSAPSYNNPTTNRYKPTIRIVKERYTTYLDTNTSTSRSLNLTTENRISIPPTTIIIDVIGINCKLIDE